MDRKIKLFVIGPRGFPGVQGGIERFSENLYPRLVEMGYEVTCFSIKKHSRLKEWKKVKFVQLPTIGLKSLENPIYNLLATIYTILHRPDIVHIHSIASGSFIFLLKLFRIKVVARYNSQDYLHGKWSRVGKSVLKFSERQFLLSDYIVTNNKSYLEFLRRQGRNNNIEYLPNGIDRPDVEMYRAIFEKRFPSLSEKRFLLYVGRVTVEKNIEFLISAFLGLQRPDLILVVAGGPAHEDKYFDAMRQRYESQNVIFLGKVGQTELGALYSACALFVFPSLHEGMPNVLLEALSFNCNILVSRIPAHLQFGFDSDIYFHPTVPEDLQQKIVARLQSSGNIHYENKLAAHDWTTITKQVNEIHEQILSR